MCFYLIKGAVVALSTTQAESCLATPLRYSLPILSRRHQANTPNRSRHPPPSARRLPGPPPLPPRHLLRTPLRAAPHAARECLSGTSPGTTPIEGLDTTHFNRTGSMETRVFFQIWYQLPVRRMFKIRHLSPGRVRCVQKSGSTRAFEWSITLGV